MNKLADHKSFTLFTPASTVDAERLYATLGRAISLFAEIELRLDEYLTDIRQSPEHAMLPDLRTCNSFKTKVKQLLKTLPNTSLPNGAIALLLKACDCRDEFVHTVFMPVGGTSTMHQRWTPGRERNAIRAKDARITEMGVNVITEDEMNKGWNTIADAQIALLNIINHPCV